MTNEPALSLAACRDAINDLDDRILALLRERAGVVTQVLAAKREKNISVFQPAREAQRLQDLINNSDVVAADNMIPPSSLLYVWRILMTAMGDFQEPVKICVAADERASRLMDLARDFWGGIPSYTRVATSAMALAALRDKLATHAVVPWPDEGGGMARPWWDIVGGDTASRVSVVGCLPAWDDGRVPLLASDKALVVMDKPFEPSHDDVTFIRLRVPSSYSRARVLEQAGACGFDAVAIYSSGFVADPALRAHLMETRGYVAPESPDLARLRFMFEDAIDLDVIGGYPRIVIDRAVRDV